jgi:hypothetical protein
MRHFVSDCRSGFTPRWFVGIAAQSRSYTLPAAGKQTVTLRW